MQLETLASLSVVEPKFFTADLLVAVLREGADELIMRREEEGMLRTFIDTSNVRDNRWGPPLVDEDWHALCQAIFNGVEERNGRPCTTSM